jgi:hypothetical protein
MILNTLSSAADALPKSGPEAAAYAALKEDKNKIKMALKTS